MKFDLTKNVALEAPWQKRYIALRAVLYVLFIFGGLYVSYMTFFPPKDFFVDLKNPAGKNNTLGFSPAVQNETVFTAYSREAFSNAIVRFDVANDSGDLLGKTVKVRKTFNALSYPLDSRPAAFPDGSLLKNGGNYYIISDGNLKKFASFAVAEALGYSTDSFLEATPEEISLNVRGEDIADARLYPNNALFVIDGNYYRLQNQTLFQFVSENAFLSFYDKSQAVSKGSEFLANFPVSEDALGFADGALLSFDNAVFIVVGGKVMPFNNPLTFLSFGYQWKDVVPANEAETGLYERDKLFTVDRSHPDGTIFFTVDSQKYFLVKDGRRQEIRGAAILKSILGSRDPIEASEKSLDFSSSCALKKTFLSSGAYQCYLPVSAFAETPGKEYQFKISGVDEKLMLSANAHFSREINWLNLRNSLSGIKTKAMSNYGLNPAN